MGCWAGWIGSSPRSATSNRPPCSNSSLAKPAFRAFTEIGSEDVGELLRSSGGRIKTDSTQPMARCGIMVYTHEAYEDASDTALMTRTITSLLALQPVSSDCPAGALCYVSVATIWEMTQRTGCTNRV